MRVFFCTVPFTIVEAVSFVIQNDIQDADLYMCGAYANAKDVGERIKETGVFNNVYIYDNMLLTYPITFEKIRNILKTSKKLFNDMKSKQYEYAYYNGTGFFSNSIFYTGVCKSKLNKNTRHMFLEHGYHSYIYRYNERAWYIRLFIRLVGLKCMDGTQLEKLYMYEPELSAVKQDTPVEKMQKLDPENERLKNALNHIFNYTPETDEFKDKRIILMEQPELKLEFDKEAFWTKVFDCINKEESIIKPHPRQKNSSLSGKGIEVCKHNTIPWEIMCLNNDLSEKVQLTIFSQACTSPKLMFDQEPTVIFLYKLLPDCEKMFSKDAISVSAALGAKYSDRSKYFTPESFEELRDYCIEKGIA